jgi:hypothetical protein
MVQEAKTFSVLSSTFLAFFMISQILICPTPILNHIAKRYWWISYTLVLHKGWADQ